MYYLPLVIAYQHAQQLDALGDPTRRAIHERLLNGPLPVGELARDFPVSRPAISQHLRILKDARLVVDRPHGNRRLYELNPGGVEALRAYFDRFWNHALESFKRAAEIKEER
jgi:DNA-binding transcriptional ArsR family regulator